MTDTPLLTFGSDRAPIWKRAARKVFRLRSLIANRATRRFIRHNRTVWRGWATSGGDPVILVDLYDVSETLISYSYFLNVLARQRGASLWSFGPSTGSRRLHSVYRSFNTAGHIATSCLSEEQRGRQRAMTAEIMPRLRTKQDVYDLEVSGIWIGVDVYETYLRRNRPTAFLDDPTLREVVEEGVGLVIFWQDYFAQHRVAAVVVSHDCYLQGALVCKVAYQARVPVYLPNPAYPTLVERPYAVHAYFPDYREMFRRLPLEEQRARIALAKRQLERRFNGEVGVNMPYATKSAFRYSGDEARVLRESSKIKVLICTHCFYDNPHAYGGFLFLDFYEWLRYLGAISERTDYDWYLKAHPDPLPGTLETIREIVKEFPRITVIPHETSHHQLAKEGIDFVLTAYGTVGHEYPALGVQVINAGYNPHVAYDFNWHPKSLDEYEYFLLNLDTLHASIDLEALYEFYYMHYYYVFADDLVFTSYRQVLEELTPAQRLGSAVYGYFLDRLTDGRHQRTIDRMREFIESGKGHLWSRGPE